MKKNRKDKNKSPQQGQGEIKTQENSSMPSGGKEKRILILVEGETEKVYFDRLKSNDLLKSQLAGIEIRFVSTIDQKPINSLDRMIFEAIKEHNNAIKVNNKHDSIWFVADNDKRNSFVISDIFFEKLQRKIPENLVASLKHSFQKDFHSYFFSTHEFINWVAAIIGHENTVLYWDIIQHCTEKKTELEQFNDINPYARLLNSDLFYNKTAQFDKDWKNYTKLAYSSIAFEFWLLLHFEQNKTPFIWVDKGKDESIDIVTYLKNHHCLDYEKGDKENKANAYTCLQINFKEKNLKFAEQWKIVLKIIQAYRNYTWLSNEMQPILEKQNNKWYEVNPFIKGLDKLIADLLNIKHQNKSFEYNGFSFLFNFDKENCTLSIKIETDVLVSEVINFNHRNCFEILDINYNSYLPINIESSVINNNYSSIFNYTIPIEERNGLILRFNQPKQIFGIGTTFLVLLD